MNVVFVSGPISDGETLGWFARTRNLWRAWKATRWLLQKGYAVHCPHLSTAFMQGVVPYEKFLEGDIEILRRCDFAFMLRGWANSKGARQERLAATLHGIPILYEEDKR
jgi:hypothetical protein